MEGETHLSHSDADKVLPSSEKKARIELGKVLFITWKSETEDSHEPDWTVIELSVPSPQEECPITQELMESPASDLEFLPGVTFQKDFPQYKRIQLKCGHAFSAMSLTYHFFKNGMLCPLCRAGQDRRLAPVCVPSHFRKKMQERLVAERAQDRVEADRENLASALLAQQSNYHMLLSSTGVLVQRIHLMIPRFMEQDTAVMRLFLSETVQMTDEEREAQRLAIFLEHHRMCLSVYAYEQDDQIGPVAVMEFPMDMWTLPPTASNTTAHPQPIGPSMVPASNVHNRHIHRGEGQGPDPNTRILSGSMQLQSLRELGRNLRGFQHPLLFRFVIGTRSLNNSVVELARSELVDLGNPNLVPGAFGGNYVASNVPGINFEIRHLEGRDDRPRELDSVVWYTSERNFLAFALECIVQGHEAQWRRIMHTAPEPETAILID